jgi:hypothetical protein
VPNFLLLDGPLNGCYASLAEAYDAGYVVPDNATLDAWDEPVLSWPS